MPRLARVAAVAAGLAAFACGSVARAEAPSVREVRIEARGQQVPATLVAPAVDGAVPLVILIHGHGGTREEAGSFGRVADALAAAGIASIRMDFAGSGESTESFANNNLTTMSTDVRAAEAFARTALAIDDARIALVGFSMGGRLAALLADEGDYAAMVIWAGALRDGAGSMVRMLGGDTQYRAMRATAERTGAVAFVTSWGQQQMLGLQWFADMERSAPMRALARFDKPLLLVHGSADAVIPVDVSVAAAAVANASPRLRLRVIDGADHGFGLFADIDRYSATLVDETVTFLVQALD